MSTNNLVQLIKKAAVEAVEASKPTVILFGTVNSVSPLSIYLEQKRTITKNFLIVTDKVKNLAIGDGVVLLRMQGGQKYIILDKVMDNE